MSDIINRFRFLYSNRYSLLKEMKTEKNIKIFGYFCTYFPEEILHAAGIHPVRITGDKECILSSDKFLPSFCCDMVKSSLQLCVSGKMDFLDGVCFADTCDTIQEFLSVCKKVLHDLYISEIIFPLKLNGKTSKKFYLCELREFIKSLQNYVKKDITDKDLRKSIEIYNGQYMLLSKLHTSLLSYRGIINWSDVYKILSLGSVIEKKEYIDLLKLLINEINTNGKDIEKSKKRNPGVIVSGTICFNPVLYEIIEEAGITVIDDFLCSGFPDFTHFTPEINTRSPLDFIADKYMLKRPCAVKYHKKINRVDLLLKKVKEINADGVIFIYLKYCDPNSYDYLPAKKALDKNGYPSLFIEYNNQSLHKERIITQVEAFKENLIVK